MGELQAASQDCPERGWPSTSLYLGVPLSIVAYTAVSTLCLTVVPESSALQQPPTTLQNAVLVLTRKQLLVLTSDLTLFEALPVKGTALLSCCV